MTYILQVGMLTKQLLYNLIMFFQNNSMRLYYIWSNKGTYNEKRDDKQNLNLLYIMILYIAFFWCLSFMKFHAITLKLVLYSWQIWCFIMWRHFKSQHSHQIFSKNMLSLEKFLLTGNRKILTLRFVPCCHFKLLKRVGIVLSSDCNVGTI